MTRGLLLLCYCLRSTGALSRAQIPPHVPTLTGTAEATLTHEWRGLKFAGSTLCFSHTQDGAKSRMRAPTGRMWSLQVSRTVLVERGTHPHAAA